MDLTGVEHLLADAAVVVMVGALLAFVAVAVVTTRVVRAVRRRWHALYRPARVPLTGFRAGKDVPATMLLSLGRATVTAAAPLASPQWWAAQGARRRMWRAVSAATHAVAVADRAGAPTGDLPRLARQLNAAARSVDALARADARRTADVGAAAVDVHRIEEAATELHRAAVDALEAVAAAEVEPLLSAVRLEVTALAAGVSSARGLRRSAT